MLPIECIGIIGKQNEPIVLSNKNIKYDLIANLSIDSIEEKLTGTVHDGYLGLLFTLEDIAVYGYITTTLIKFVLIMKLTDDYIKDIEVKKVFAQIHSQYTKLLSSPFYTGNDQDKDQLVIKLDEIIKSSAAPPTV